MSILDRILGRGPDPSPQITATPRRTSPPTASRDALPAVALEVDTPAGRRAPAEGVVRVYDAFGRKVEIGREAWRRDVLLPNLAASRDDADASYSLIVGALDDGFADDVLEPARHLAAHDPQPRRGALALGVVLLQLRDFAVARDVLEDAVRRHGADAHLLANLARAHAGLGDEQRALDFFWQALELDPNEETSLGWLIAVLRVKGGQAAVTAACERAAALPGSWRALLTLARFALERGDVAAATRLYQEALGRATPAPADLLMQMSGDLGNRGQTELLLKLTLPHFVAVEHGLAVGNNLLRACIELGLPAEARKLLEQLYAAKRPDWREPLLEWETRLDDAEKRYGEVQGPIDVVVVKLDQPVWARGTLGFDALLPTKAATAPRIHFVCGSGEAEAESGGKVVSQPTNELGRLSRALPMFLTEQLHLTTNARTSFLLPWVKQGGFILAARPWTPAFLPPDHVAPDLVVFLHIDARATPWLLRVTIENLQRQASAVVFERAFTRETAGEDVMALLADVTSRLTILLALRREESAAALAMPAQRELPGYLAALEQALAIGLAARHSGTNQFLYQERAIVDHLFDVALRSPALLRPRLLLLNALEHESRRRPDIAAEFHDTLRQLHDTHPVPAGSGADLVASAVDTLVRKSPGA